MADQIERTMTADELLRYLKAPSRVLIIALDRLYRPARLHKTSLMRDLATETEGRTFRVRIKNHGSGAHYGPSMCRVYIIV